jgi:ApeA N-terminal domain 1
MFQTNRYVKPGNVSMISSDQSSEGLWWISSSDNSNAEVSGTLHITSTGIFLIVNGTFDNTNDSRPFQELSEHDIILGIQSSGFKFTLERCIEVENKSPIGGGYNTQTYSIDFVYCGIHATDIASLKFDNYSVDYTYLHDWLRNVGLRHPDEYEDGYIIQYDSSSHGTVSDLIASVEGAFIEFKSFPVFTSHIDSVEIKISEIINIKCDSKTTVKDVIKLFLEPLGDFLSLATTQQNLIKSFSIKLDKSNIPVYFKSSYQSENYSPLFNRGVILFYAKSICIDPTYHLEKWFSLEREMRDVCELFFGVHYNQQEFATNRFLNVIQALEAYGRVRYGAEKVPKDEHRERFNAIMGSAPEEHKEWLSNTLSHSNYKNLRDFLSILIKNLQPVLNDLIPNQKEFISWVIDTRNYLTHLDSKGKKKIAREDDLDCLSSSLLWVLRIHFLLEIGFDPSKCSEFLCGNMFFKYLCKYQAPWRQTKESMKSVNRGLNETGL